MADTVKRAGEHHDFDKEVILRVRLAIKRGSYREAEIMIATILSKDDPGRIATELRELLMQVVPHLQRAVGD